MQTIQKARREWFGGVVFSENQGLLAHIDNHFADKIGLLRVDGLPQGILRAPVDVELSLTTRCNRTCNGCQVRQVGGDDRDLPYDLALRIVEALARLDIFRLTLSGGEPLLYPRLFDLAGQIRDLNIAPAILTNGMLIDAASASRWRVFSAVFLGCNTVRELECLEGAISLLVREGIHPALNLHVNRETYPFLPGIFSLAARRGIQKIRLSLFKSAAANAGASALRLSVDQQRELYPLLVSLSRRFKIMPLFDCALHPAVAFHKPKDKDLRAFDINGCKGADLTLAVDVDGQMRPCPFWPESYGPAEHLTPEGWLQNPGLQSFRAGLAVEACNPCAYLESCNRGCRLVERQACGVLTRSSLKPASPSPALGAP